LDEPTNHLDIDTLTWLEQYLQSYDGAILIVSHDRYFLDKLVNQVYECAQTTLTKYVGNYSQYLVQKAENYERDLKMYEKQQDEIARMKEFISTFFICLVICSVAAFVFAGLILDSLFGILIVISFIISVFITIFVKQESKIDELEKKVESLLNSN